MSNLDWIIQNGDWLSITLVILIFTWIAIRYYTKRDEFEKEPSFRLILAFLFGILSVIPALIFSILMSDLLPNLSSSIIIAPFSEEIAKGLFVIVLARSREFDGPMDGMVYGGLVGVGFASAENLLYAFSAFLQSGFISGLLTASFRSIFEVVGHPLFTGSFGYSVGRWKVGLGKFKWGGIWRSILLHAIWNANAGLNFSNVIIRIIILGIIYLFILRKLFSKARMLDKDASQRGYYKNRSNEPYIAI